jgi:hypothetical protein
LGLGGEGKGYGREGIEHGEGGDGGEGLEGQEGGMLLEQVYFFAFLLLLTT